MVATAKKTSSKKKTPAAVETSDSIAEQTAAFLKGGGKIETIDSGVSGQVSMASKKQITISTKKD